MRHAILIVALAAAAGGCVPSYPGGKSQLDRSWVLTDLSAGANPAPRKSGGGFQMPTTVVIRETDDHHAASESIKRAMADLTNGTGRIEFSVSPQHARQVNKLLGDISAAMDRMTEMLDTAGQASENEWADALASALVHVRAVSERLTSALTAPASPSGGESEPSGAAAEPLLHVITMYLNGQLQGGLLADLAPAEKRRVQSVLTEIVVQVGFEIAGKTATRQTHREVSEMLEQKTDPADLKTQLAALLTRQIADAPPSQGGKKKFVQSLLKWGPRFLDIMETFLDQWPNMDHMTFELLQRNDNPMFSLVIALKPGKQIRIADIATGVPTLVFRGTVRVLGQPNATCPGEAVVSFQSLADRGAIELRYEGAVYDLAKAFAMPLASGPIREIRVSAGMPPEGPQLLNITILSEASNDKTDRRRLMVVQSSGLKRLVRDAFKVDTVTERSVTAVSYITPQKRYTYLKTSSEPAQ